MSEEVQSGFAEGQYRQAKFPFADGGGTSHEGAVGGSDEKRRAERMTSPAPTADLASSWFACSGLASSWAASKGGANPLTTRRSEKPKSCMARAAAPMFCGLRAPTRTTVRRRRASAVSMGSF